LPRVKGKRLLKALKPNEVDTHSRGDSLSRTFQLQEESDEY